jgi:hypothetical protein
MPSEATTAEAIISALHHASVPVPTWHMAELDRWCLFRDFLFGNMRVRGSLRPRDLPLDATCMQVLEAATFVHSFPPYAVRNGRISFRHWLTAFCLLNSVAKDKTAERRIPPSQQLACVVMELVTALYAPEPAEDIPPESIAKHPFTQRLIGVLGLSQQEWDSLWKKCQENTATRSVWLARFAALVMAIPDPPQITNGDRFAWREELARKIQQDGFPEVHAKKQRATLASLDERHCKQATLKIPGVQRYIARGKNHWNFRGASAWCSQTLGVARDLFLDASEGLMSSDSDAIVAAWVPESSDETSLNNTLKSLMERLWAVSPDVTEPMHRRFPRLAEWLTQEINKLRADDPQCAPLNDTQLPEFSVRCKGPWSLLDICVQRVPKEQKTRCVADIPRPAADEAAECAHVIGHPPVFSSYPPWLRAHEGQQRVGVAAVAWSLCGTTYRTHSHEGLCEAIGNRDLQLLPVHHGEWLDALGMPESRLTHLKLDGDGVGDRFRAEPLANSTLLSMELARSMQRRLIAGVRETLAVHKRDYPELTNRPLPIDVVYLGGDDLYVCLPWDLVDRFLVAFGTDDTGCAPWKTMTFTFIAARLQAKKDILAGVDSADWRTHKSRLDDANQTAARLLTYGLRNVKDSQRDATPLDMAALQSLADLQGMTLRAEPTPYEQNCLRGRVIDVTRT